MSTNREFLTRFIHAYKAEPCLWSVKSKDYHDRRKKDRAYQKLIAVLSEIEPNATRQSVVRFINNIRSPYRRERKKMRDSIRSGAMGNDVYKPWSWYYHMLSFLDQDGVRNSDGDDENGGEEFVYNEEIVPFSMELVEKAQPSTPAQDTLRIEEAPSDPEPSRSSRRRKLDSDTEVLDLEKALSPSVLLTVYEQFKKARVDEDRFDIVGKNVAMRLRDLPRQQMLLAENIINQTLFEAELGRLTLAHKLAKESAD